MSPQDKFFPTLIKTDLTVVEIHTVTLNFSDTCMIEVVQVSTKSA